MKEKLLVICPGRGTYNATELGYLKRYHADRSDMIAQLDAYRTAQGQPTISELDGAEKYSPSLHMPGDNASLLINACALADFAAIDRDRFDIVAVTGNSMGWYLALACAGVLDFDAVGQQHGRPDASKRCRRAGRLVDGRCRLAH
jgi:[acyl-carrier-protein] S-malonyltransferase